MRLRLSVPEEDKHKVRQEVGPIRYVQGESRDQGGVVVCAKEALIGI